MLEFFVLCFLQVGAVIARPLCMVDLTYTFDETIPRYPWMKGFELNVLFNGTDDGILWAQLEEYSSEIHLGTHMDAPAHTTKGGATVEQLPITSFIAPAAVIDITDRAALDPDEGVTTEDLMKWEVETGESLDGKIVLMRFGWGEKWTNRSAYLGISGNDTEEVHFPGLLGSAAQWLVDNRKIVGIGTEAITFDVATARSFPAHRILLGSGVYALECVANMDELPISGAILSVMPMKIGRASGAPTRIIAFVPCA